jgi:hypothetical protein
VEVVVVGCVSGAQLTRETNLVKVGCACADPPYQTPSHYLSRPTADFPARISGKRGRILDRGRADCMVEESITVDGMLTPFPLCATNYPGRAYFVRLSGILSFSEITIALWLTLTIAQSLSLCVNAKSKVGTC